MIVVNRETVDPELIDEAFHRIKSEAEALTDASCCSRDDEFRRRAEDEVIDGILLAQEAERRSDEPAAETVRAELEDAIRQWRKHGASWDLLEQRRGEIRREVVADLKMRQFIDSVCGHSVVAEEDACRRWYDEHLDRFRSPARAEALHLVRFPDRRPAEEAYRFLIELRGRVLAGEDFESLAREHTDKPDGGIELGWVEHQRVLNAFEATLFSLREHEVSPVMYYEQAFHLVWIKTLEPERVAPYEEVVGEVAELAAAERRREALTAVAAELRETAEIERE